MNNIKVRLNKLRVDNEQYQQDSDGFIHLSVADGCKVSDLYELFAISAQDMKGIVVLVNSKSCKDIETVICNDDVIEIFRLFAGG